MLLPVSLRTPNLPILAISGLENRAKVWAPIGEHKPLVQGSEKVTESSADRTGADAHSSDSLKLLVSLLDRGNLPLHDHGTCCCTTLILMTQRKVAALAAMVMVRSLMKKITKHCSVEESLDRKE